MNVHENDCPEGNQFKSNVRNVNENHHHPGKQSKHSGELKKKWKVYVGQKLKYCHRKS